MYHCMTKQIEPELIKWLDLGIWERGTKRRTVKTEQQGEGLDLTQTDRAKNLTLVQYSVT